MWGLRRQPHLCPVGLKVQVVGPTTPVRKEAVTRVTCNPALQASHSERKQTRKRHLLRCRSAWTRGEVLLWLTGRANKSLKLLKSFSLSVIAYQTFCLSWSCAPTTTTTTTSKTTPTNTRATTTLINEVNPFYGKKTIFLSLPLAFQILCGLCG